MTDDHRTATDVPLEVPRFDRGPFRAAFPSGGTTRAAARTGGWSIVLETSAHPVAPAAPGGPARTTIVTRISVVPAAPHGGAPPGHR